MPSLPLLPSPDELRLDTWVQLFRTTSLLQRRITTLLAQHRLTLPQFDILATLRFNPPLTQQDLADSLLVTKGNICGLITRLSNLKFVQRHPDPVDARANRLHLTPTGRRKIDTVLPHHNALILHTFQSLTPPALTSLQHTLQTLDRANLQENKT